MEKFKKTQIAELLLVAGAALLVIIKPLSSTASLRSADLVVNIIIINCNCSRSWALLLFPPTSRKQETCCCCFCCIAVIISGVLPYRKEKMDGTDRPHQSAMATQAVENRSPDKIFGAFHEDPSISFIGGGENTETEAKYVADDEGEEVGEVIFIGNFYKQLNIQREESWKKYSRVHCN